ncbi:tumor protein p63-regulated gene 1 protein [Corythoichthys intestinalis]|uniref:tumor protein p63-regulated gene 1 protein n=1 Tax=Corythoichthys intestinalis TaxID=161448 RepID=UPI0025A68F18|nr:tumor protein p63-regulated gene 1 protein [Corythoichthys intestinalis]XP_057696226.1 tumor protein p63-regulated gene 1 protein [Corythoichthys intestinalis]XP_057696227.1 tumor protein p63-regulated gene 1 protein [Corythoichthys intestinalis]
MEEAAVTLVDKVAASAGEVAGGEAEEPVANSRDSRSLFEDPSGEPSLCVNDFKCKKYFVLRPGTLQQAIKEVKVLIDPEVDGNILGIWLMAEVDHWNNEKERLCVITDNFLLVCKYDFVMFQCEQIQKIPLNMVDRICYGNFTFPPNSVLHREGEGLRVFWDRLREPSFVSWWNPFTTDLPFITFTEHPVRLISNAFATICNMENFRSQLKEAAQQAHKVKPVPGKANGVMLLNQSIFIKAYFGLMSFLGNTNKLGYCVARGNIGF